MKDQLYSATSVVWSLKEMLKAAPEMVRFYPKVITAGGPSLRPVPTDFARLRADIF